MSEFSRVFHAIEVGERLAVSELLPLVYDELRRMAQARVACESPSHSITATALVHEAYLRLVGPANAAGFENRGHFFAAAGLAMRRILVDAARRRKARRRHDNAYRMEAEDHILAPVDDDRLVALDGALAELEQHDAVAAQLVHMRYFAGLSHQDAAHALGLTRRQADRLWATTRAWLYRCVKREPEPK